MKFALVEKELTGVWNNCTVCELAIPTRTRLLLIIVLARFPEILTLVVVVRSTLCQFERAPEAATKTRACLVEVVSATLTGLVGKTVGSLAKVAAVVVGIVVLVVLVVLVLEVVVLVVEVLVVVVVELGVVVEERLSGVAILVGTGTG